jgi:hypothetical protein
VSCKGGLSRGVDVAEGTPGTPWTGSGRREYAFGGFGGGRLHFRPHARCRKLNFQLPRSGKPRRSSRVLGIVSAWVFHLRFADGVGAPGRCLSPRLSCCGSWVWHGPWWSPCWMHRRAGGLCLAGLC